LVGITASPTEHCWKHQRSRVQLEGIWTHRRRHLKGRRENPGQCV